MFNAALTLRREAFTLGGVMDQASVFFLGGGPTETVEVYPRFHMGTYTQVAPYMLVWGGGPFETLLNHGKCFSLRCFCCFGLVIAKFF